MHVCLSHHWANVRGHVLQSLRKCHSARSSLDIKSLKCLMTQRKLIIKCLSEKRKAKKYMQGFPGGTVVGNPPADAGDLGLSPGPGRSHMPRSN